MYTIVCRLVSIVYYLLATNALSKKRNVVAVSEDEVSDAQGNFAVCVASGF